MIVISVIKCLYNQYFGKTNEKKKLLNLITIILKHLVQPSEKKIIITGLNWVQKPFVSYKIYSI